MGAQYTLISQQDIENLLGVSPNGTPIPGGLGFYRIDLKDGTKELVYAKRVRHDLSLRVYSSVIPSYGSRKRGSDAIRVALFWKSPKGEIKKIATDRRVHRTQGWRKSLTTRISHWAVGLMGTCQCGAPLVKRVATKTKEEFLGCCMWPNCPNDTTK